MDSAAYRARAEQLVTRQHAADLPSRYVEQAAVWAQLATAAAITETAQTRPAPTTTEEG